MEKKNKLRFEDVKSMETRVAKRNYDSVIARMNGKSACSLDIPLEIIPHGWVYKWVAHSVYKSGDVPLSNKLAEASQEGGWDPVPINRHPELVSFDPMGRDHHLREFIYKDGLILCERPKEIDDLENRRNRSEAVQAMNHVNQYDQSPYGRLNIDANQVTRSMHL